MNKPNSVNIPLDVPPSVKKTYFKNYNDMTKNSGRLMLFAGDQKTEHLNGDFYGEGIASDDATPLHLFDIASKSKIGVFATQLGLVARYGMDYPSIPYLVKINSKTNLVDTKIDDPMSKSWYPIKYLMKFQKDSGLNILGIGYTIYLGSKYENEMLREAARVIFEAHQYGLITVVWAYPRGITVKDEKNPHLIAGAAGVACTLGADFVKINAPKQEGKNSNELLKEAVLAAGRTQVVCAGGSTTNPEKFLQSLYNQIHTGGVAGNATGRNIHQKPIAEAVRFCNAIYAITVKNKSVEEALKIYEGKLKT